MKRFLFFLLFFPVVCGAQKLKFNAFDKYLKQWRAESFPVNVKATPEIKMDVALRSADTSFFLRLAGSGIGTSTVDVGNEVVFTLENGSVVTARSASVQSIEYGSLIPVYRHEYVMSLEDIESLSRHDLKSLRKYSVGGFDDVVIEKKNAGKVRQLSILFLTELKNANALVIKPSVKPPGFPGGSDVLLRFLNRNLKPVAELAAGEKKLAVVQFQVTADGMVNNLQIKQSAGDVFDNELLRILQRMPRWKPAVQSGKQVEAWVTQQVTFYKTDSTLLIQL